MLQAMAFGGYLGDSLYSNVSFSSLSFHPLSRCHFRSLPHPHTFPNNTATPTSSHPNPTTPSPPPPAASAIRHCHRVSRVHPSLTVSSRPTVSHFKTRAPPFLALVASALGLFSPLPMASSSNNFLASNSSLNRSTASTCLSATTPTRVWHSLLRISLLRTISWRLCRTHFRSLPTAMSRKY